MPSELKKPESDLTDEELEKVSGGFPPGPPCREAKVGSTFEAENTAVPPGTPTKLS